jgi:hypothetical protein
VEVLLRKQKLIQQLSFPFEESGLRKKSDRSADASGARSQAPFSLPEKALCITGFREICLLLDPKTYRQRSEQRKAQWSGNYLLVLRGRAASQFFCVTRGMPTRHVFLFVESLMTIEQLYTCWPIGLPRSSCELDSQS